MKSSYILVLVSILSALGLNSCQKSANSISTNDEKIILSEDFTDYWYAGKAELASYELKQTRYGEIRDGHAVLIFVTEPFSKSKQVKLDNPSRSGKDKVSVMKLNFTKKFNTGIYPYSMMLSTFTPIDIKTYPHSKKVTMSSQEWCGHVFSQLNLADDKFTLQAYSYFEQEGDQKYNLEKALLEDEIWNLVRINHKALPTGEIDIIPGLFYVRLGHKPLKALKANTKLISHDEINSYSISYPERILTINFENKFPHRILSWEETYKGLNGDELTATGKLKETMHLDYWNKNSNADEYLRDSLKVW